MTRFLLFLIAILGFTESLFGQRKLILTNDYGRYVFRTGDEVGITLKGQPYIFKDWKTICKACDTTVQKNLWTIDSIRDDSFILSRITSYSYDTISQDKYYSALKEWEKQKKSFPVIDKTFFRDTIVTYIRKQDTVKVAEKKEMYVLKYRNHTRKEIYYDSIQSITFAQFTSQDACSSIYTIIPFTLSLVGVYEFIIEARKHHPDNKRLLLAVTTIIFGAIWTDTSISIRNNNVETINMIAWKRKTK